MSLLTVRDLRASYGAIEVLRGIGLQIGRGEIVALLGANGAGKTTTLRAVCGTLASSGLIELEGASLRGVSAAERVRRGMAHVPQGRGTFVDFSVEENLELGAYALSDRRTIRARMQQWYSTFPRLAQRRQQAAGSLSGGEQQMLAIARALMSGPSLLLCDEPSLGLAPAITQEVFATLQRLNRDEGLSILLVEQNANLTLPIAHRAYVMEAGVIAVQGKASELLDDPAVRHAYLGMPA